jgi:large subunit ribosomal protein L6
MPVAIPSGVKVEYKSNHITVHGPKGKLEQTLDPVVRVQLQDDSLEVIRSEESRRARALHGLYRSLVNNMVRGVSEGFTKTLLVSGVGYRAELKGNSLMLNLGFSNTIEYPIPQNITIQVEANTRITVSGIDKEQLGQVCAEIRSFRPPEPYKGKGIRYGDERVRRKVGKTGVK